MALPAMQPAVLIIAGMHRSGTSLTASLLQQAGLDVGSFLVGSAKGNPKGHFENVDFMEFHRIVLQSQGLDPSGWTTQAPIAPTEAQIAIAKTIVDRNATRSLWGWKDPRTTLFLDFWATLLPEANFLLLVRAPWEVADSLFRRRLREDAVFATRPEFAIEVWQHYNRQVLDFWQQHRDRCILATVDRITQQPEAVFAQLRQQFAIDLATPQSEIYDRTLLNTAASTDHRAGLVQLCFPETLHLYHQLLIQEAKIYDLESESLLGLGHLSSSQMTTGVFQDWYDVRKLSDRLSDSQAQLILLQTQLTETQAELAQTQQELLEMQAHYRDAMRQLDTAQVYLTQRQETIATLTAQLQQSEQALQQTQSQLQRTQQQLQTTVSGMEQAEMQIAAMETSKFWKLRQAWFRVRDWLGLPE